MEKILGGWEKVPQNLKCKTDLKKIGLKPTVGANFQVWNSYNWIPLYDIAQTTPILPPTEEEKAARKLARQDKKDRTCQSCRSVVKDKIYITENLCLKCQTIKNAKIEALANFQKWFNNKNDYLILDTETTGLDQDAEIVEVAVCDLNGAVIFESLAKPLHPIPDDVIEIHGITNEMVSDAPSWPDVWNRIQPLLSNKIILIYNAAFDTRMIYNNRHRHDLPKHGLKTECIMQNYAKYQGNYSHYHKNFTWISLHDATEDWSIDTQSHRAASDCIASPELIKCIVEHHKKS